MSDSEKKQCDIESLPLSGRILHLAFLTAVGIAFIKDAADERARMPKAKKEEKEKVGPAWTALLSIGGIGVTAADSLCAFVTARENVALLRILQTEFLITPFTGKNIIFTGELKSMERDEATFRAERLGANVGSTVSSKTDFVVGPGEGRKRNKAIELDIEIIDEVEWLRRLEAISEGEVGGNEEG